MSQGLKRIRTSFSHHPMCFGHQVSYSTFFFIIITWIKYVHDLVQTNRPTACSIPPYLDIGPNIPPMPFKKLCTPGRTWAWALKKLSIVAAPGRRREPNIAQPSRPWAFLAICKHLYFWPHAYTTDSLYFLNLSCISLMRTKPISTTCIPHLPLWSVSIYSPNVGLKVIYAFKYFKAL